MCGWRRPVRGASQGKKGVTVGNGSGWIWSLYAENFPFNRVEVFDCFHGSEHLAELARACRGEGPKPARQWHTKQAVGLRKCPVSMGSRLDSSDRA
jgi:hypothetical protein